jgi:acyl-CoA reductase-like NAD-dependent aldehyde dehydrogenase
VLFDLLAEAGLDRRLVALLPESAAAAGTAILARPDKVIFTGSAATGEKILAQLAPQLIPATMELSGCDAVLVRADADLDLVVRALKFGLTLNAGATCLAPKRVFVHRGIATELEGRLANVFCRNRNAGTSTSTESRSFSASVAAEKLRPFLDDAVARGAHFIAGGIRDDGQIAVPLVLAGVAPESRLLREDIFAPVLAIVTVADDHEALQRINDCPFALGASIFSRDEADARLLAGRINAGVVSINDLIIPTADARLPFGGRKRSGFGLTRGAEGLLELTAAKVVTVSRGRFRPAFDESRPGDEELFHSYLQLAHGADWKARLAALFRLCKQILSRLKNSRLKL